MEIETKVNIISTEIIRPSSPTPKSLQKHQLSFIDQFAAPPNFLPFVYFYSSLNPKTPNSEKSSHLKNSLSETLSRFYPVAGSLVDNLYVNCNDAGVPFSEAEANCNLSQAITNENPKSLTKFLPYKLSEPQAFCLAVQATYFRCGGVAVGLLMSHKIGDTSSIVMFTNAWSAVARNGDVPIPKFDCAAYFPPRDTSGHNQMVVPTEEEVAIKIFTFSSARIAAIQESYAAGNDNLRPSRVEALSAYIWTRFLLATGTRGDPAKIYNVHHTVNLRSRVNPRMSENHFGNVAWHAVARAEAGDGGAELVQKLKDAKKALYEGYTAEMNAMKELVSQPDDEDRVINFMFSSLCGFSFYDADFGWGKPVWVSLRGFNHKNAAFFMDTKSGGGIEALIHLRKQDMKKFEAELMD